MNIILRVENLLIQYNSLCNWNYFFLLTAKLATKKQNNVPLSLTAINTPVHSKPEKSEATI